MSDPFSRSRVAVVVVVWDWGVFESLETRARNASFNSKRGMFESQQLSCRLAFVSRSEMVVRVFDAVKAGRRWMWWSGGVVDVMMLSTLVVTISRGDDRDVASERDEA